MQQNRPLQQAAGRSGANRNPRDNQRRRRRLRLLRNWILFLGACGLCAVFMTSGILWVLPRAQALMAGPKDFAAREYDATGYAFDAEDSRLTLVNNNLPQDTSAVPELAVADDATGERLEAEAAAAYRAMAQAAAADGIELVLAGGYQDLAEQQTQFDAQKQSCLERGLSEEQAEARAQTVVPLPGCNESGLGLAADILSSDYSERDSGFGATRAFEWLNAYAAEYGFILRWPQDRQLATGMVCEPWHWRYVGAENAQAIQASGLSLEEFLAVETLG